ncbi:ThiF family adenylyltransferase [Bradyrhizobium sp. NBAIM20]|uniref:ThiF family adenylyltransferase n=1 Tax=unclassified Bradyrhizobium TaxID=2631580 RepID=UPI001CD24B3B|nr:MULTISPECIES: ThiF family adenylyltransferase [unclassified Bradyrhizobium]MCA1411668.1 ThiF family adenylyltransferase [Bradyrhizobium sp. NBAIM20]MCA1460997.1 ThiF family adenylyltransferase [Bradyrhizobium sp. NBAIM18]
MSGLRFVWPTYRRASADLLASAPLESCGVAYSVHDPHTDTWLVDDVESVADSAYEHRDEVSATLRPAFIVEVANRARALGRSVVLVHTHPFEQSHPRFSAVDDAGEVALAGYLRRRAPQGEHLALVLSEAGCRARRIGTAQEVPVWQVGERLVLLSSDKSTEGSDVRYDRQVRAFGADGQRVISSLKVGVVGVGGTGSVLLQQLTRLGVRDFVLIDPDVVETTNLNRLAGAGPSDVGTSKIAVAEREILACSSTSRVRGLRADVVDANIAAELVGLDFVFLCTDSHASRAVVCHVAYQYLVPTIDMGTSITVREGAVTHISGRVQMLAPELPCLTCTGALDGNQIRREMMSPERRASDPYLVGDYEPQPAVMSINTTMASLAATMFMAAVTSMPGQARFQLYEGVRGAVRPTQARRVDDCVVCSRRGALAKGPSWPLPVRPRANNG